MLQTKPVHNVIMAFKDDCLESLFSFMCDRTLLRVRMRESPQSANKGSIAILQYHVIVSPFLLSICVMILDLVFKSHFQPSYLPFHSSPGQSILLADAKFPTHSWHL